MYYYMLVHASDMGQEPDSEHVCSSNCLLCKYTYVYVCVHVHTDVQYIEGHSHRFTEQTML